MKLAASAWQRRGAVSVGIAISVVCLVLIARRVDLPEVAREIGGARLLPLAATLLTKALAVLFLTGRSILVLHSVGRYKPRTVLRSILLAFLGNAVLPLRMGELLRVEYLAREGSVSRAGPLAAVVFERLLDFFWLLVMLAAVSPLVVGDWSRARSLLFFGLVVVGAVATLVAIGLFPERALALARGTASLLGKRAQAIVAPRAEAFTRGLATVRSAPQLGAVLGLSLGYWLASAGSVWLWLVAFQLDLPWFAPFVVLVFLAFGTAIPSSPGFIGTYDYFAMQALTLFAVPAATAASVAVVGHVLGIVPLSLVALAVLFPTFRSLLADRVRDRDGG